MSVTVVLRYGHETKKEKNEMFRKREKRNIARNISNYAITKIQINILITVYLRAVLRTTPHPSF